MKSTVASMVLEIKIHDIGNREHQGSRNFNMKSKSKGIKIAINTETREYDRQSWNHNQSVDKTLTFFQIKL